FGLQPSKSEEEKLETEMDPDPIKEVVPLIPLPVEETKSVIETSPPKENENNPFEEYFDQLNKKKNPSKFKLMRQDRISKGNQVNTQKIIEIPPTDLPKIIETGEYTPPAEFKRREEKEPTFISSGEEATNPQQADTKTKSTPK